MPDSRQRARFAHTSSSADLTSPDIISPIRAFPNQTWETTSLSEPEKTEKTRGMMARIWGKSLTKKGSNEQLNGGGIHEKMENNTYIVEPPRQSPSPRPIGFLSTFPLPTIRFVCLCGLWYISSAISSNTGKVILNNFRYPVTLTIVQFLFVSSFCVISSKLGLAARLRDPTKSILRGTLPMAVFQVGGHIFGSLAISRVPVSTVHTIKVSCSDMIWC